MINEDYFIGLTQKPKNFACDNLLVIYTNIKAGMIYRFAITRDASASQ